MRYPLLFAVSYLLSATCLADVTFKTCSRSPQENATVTLDDLGAFHINVHVGDQTFVSSTCKPIGFAGIECSGDWKTGKGSVILDSMDGVLNVLMYKGPEPLPAQYDDDRPLFCGTPVRASALGGALQHPEDNERHEKG